MAVNARARVHIVAMGNPVRTPNSCSPCGSPVVYKLLADSGEGGAVAGRTGFPDTRARELTRAFSLLR